MNLTIGRISYLNVELASLELCVKLLYRIVSFESKLIFGVVLTQIAQDSPVTA
jgi:hypothetical protein